jgi:hypothetical protein
LRVSTRAAPYSPITVAEEPLTLIEGGGKLRNSIFLRGVALYRDRVAFEVFASRPFDPEELESLRLTDNLGTHYEMLPLALETLDGRGRIEFVPGAPAAWSHLHFGEPGWGLHIVAQPD